jgi:mono/diheme cytochrome c family protein
VWKQFLGVAILTFACLPASIAQDQKPADKPSDFKVPPEIAKQTNPVKPTAASQAQAKKTYNIDCAMCHGKDGDGQGDLAIDMKLQLLDYRDPAALKDRSDGELFFIIQKGKGEMSGQGDRSKPDDVWSLVTYIHSFARKPGNAKSEKP